MTHLETEINILREAGLLHSQHFENIEVENGEIKLKDDNIIPETVEIVGGEGVFDVKNNSVKTNLKTAEIKYQYANVSLEWVAKNRDEVEAEIASMLNEEDRRQHEGVLTYVVRLWTAGKLLIADYGLAGNLENTSKDGYRKIETAKAKLDLLILQAGLKTLGDTLGYDSGNLIEKRR